ncbi:hypothetical protein JOM56_009725 [Amanita muscaria]
MMDTVANLVAAYERLSERVRVTLRTQVGNARGLHDVQMEVRAFCDSAHNMRERVPPLDFISLEGSLAKMLDSLQAAERNALEPANPGVQVSFRVAGVRGRPRVEINKNYLEHVLDIRGPYELTDVFKCSARTIRRRAVEYGLRGPGLAPFLNEELPDGSLARWWVSSGKRARSAISGNAMALETVVASVLATFPGYGRCKVDGALRAQGIRVPRDSLIAAIQRLIRWRIICHAFVDGKTRLVTGARFNNNNRADTVLELFKHAISVHGLPSRLTTWMNNEDLGAVRIYGAVHNTRIERLWVDIVHDLSSKWKEHFEVLEIHHGLDADHMGHTWLLHHLFLKEMNAELSEWVQGWNSHKMQLRGQRNQSPHEMFVIGITERECPGVHGWIMQQEDAVVDLEAFGVEEGENRLDNGEDQRVDTRPERFSEVRCDSPNCPLDADQLYALDESLAQAFGQDAPRSMLQRKFIWDHALDICRAWM